MSNIQDLLDKHVFADDALEALDYACRKHKRILLYGPKGHGKSYFSKNVALKYFDEKDIFKIQAGAGSTLEVVTGYLNFAKYQAEGIKENNMENSMLSYKVVIIEELFDWFDKLLLYFKDVVMAGELCLNGNMCYKSKNLVIIACTNLDPYQWAKMGRPEEVESRLAFLDRFFYKVKVEWPDYSQLAWGKMIEKRFSKEEQIKLKPMISLMAMCHSQGTYVSPRMAEEYFKVYLEDSFDALKHTDIPSELLASAKEAGADLEQDVKILVRIEEIREQVEKMIEEFSYETMEDLHQINEERVKLDEELAGMTVGHTAAISVGRTRTRLMILEKKIEEGMDDLNPPETDDYTWQ